MIRPTEKEIRHPNSIHNVIRLNVLNFLRTESPTSRSQLAKHLNISLPTVMRTVDELIQNGLVRETGEKQASGGGRPRSLIEFDGSDNAVISVDLGYPNMYGILSDLAGNIHCDLSVPIQLNDPLENISRLKNLISDLLTSSETVNQPVRGIGLGLPGIIDSCSGIVRVTPELGWQNYPLVEVLSDSFPIPIFIDKDTNLTTLGEYGFGVAQNTENMMCVAIGTGIGLGIIINHEIFRGAHFSAGNIGGLISAAPYSNDRLSHADKLENVASGTALVKKARQYFDQNQLPYPETSLKAAEILNAARMNSSWANEVTKEMIEYLSFTIAALAAVVDPSAVVLGGRLASSADVLAERITANLESKLGIVPEIKASNLGSKATVLGTIMLVFNGTFEKRLNLVDNLV